MIDIASEHLLTPSEAARGLPRRRRGRPIHVSTIFRWIDRGVRGVRLEAIRIGGAEGGPQTLDSFRVSLR